MLQHTVNTLPIPPPHLTPHFQVRSGGLAERIATEGVMLQYAVDTHMDQLLAALWLQITQPPMPVNPFPKLMNLIRRERGRG